MIEPRYNQAALRGRVKSLSMQQALEIAYLVMDHVPQAERAKHANEERQLNDGSRSIPSNKILHGEIVKRIDVKPKPSS